MRILMPYGDGQVTADMAWGRLLGVLDVADAPELPGLDEAIRQAIEKPIGLTRNLYDIIRPGESVAVLVSDAFRQTGADRVLPVMFEGLERAGISLDDCCIVFATGTHRSPTEVEQARILGPAVSARFRGRTFVHDPGDEANLVFIGTTSRGTSVKINKRVCACDRLIATGAVVLHYFAGYGGGRKSICPGIAGTETIAHNHARNLDPKAPRLNPAVRIGRLDGNPVAEDMLEAARLVNVDCIVNTVLNRHGQIAGVFAGEMDAAHRAAARFAYDLFAVSIPERADLVIASAGAAKNFVQSHKALFNAYQAVKPEGRIIFLAQCPERYGGNKFAQWLSLGNREAIIAGLRRNAEINGQTALSTREKAPSAIMLSDLTGEEVVALGAQKAGSLSEALEQARADLRRRGIADPTCYLMPSASYTVPIPVENADDGFASLRQPAEFVKRSDLAL